MDIVPNRSYCSIEECTLSIFNLRHPAAAQRQYRERAALPVHSGIEALDESHSILIVWPAGARWLTL